jgi:hypothetical protein
MSADDYEVRAEIAGQLRDRRGRGVIPNMRYQSNPSRFSSSLGLLKCHKLLAREALQTLQCACEQVLLSGIGQ